MDIPRHSPVPVKVVTVFSPCKVAIRYTDATSIEALHALEIEMTKKWKSMEPFDEEGMMPQKDMNVLLKCDDYETCRRGYMLCVYENVGERVYEIFLYDYGIIRMLKDSELDNLVLLKDEYITRIAPLSSILTIPGIRPCRKLELPNGDIRVGPKDSWTVGAASFTKAWVANGTIGCVALKKLDRLTLVGELHKKGEPEPFTSQITSAYHAMFEEELLYNQMEQPEVAPPKLTVESLIEASIMAGAAPSPASARPSTKDTVAVKQEPKATLTVVPRIFPRNPMSCTTVQGSRSEPVTRAPVVPRTLEELLDQSLVVTRSPVVPRTLEELLDQSLVESATRTGIRDAVESLLELTIEDRTSPSTDVNTTNPGNTSCVPRVVHDGESSTPESPSHVHLSTESQNKVESMLELTLAPSTDLKPSKSSGKALLGNTSTAPRVVHDGHSSTLESPSHVPLITESQNKVESMLELTLAQSTDVKSCKSSGSSVTSSSKAGIRGSSSALSDVKSTDPPFSSESKSRSRPSIDALLQSSLKRPSSLTPSSINIVLPKTPLAKQRDEFTDKISTKRIRVKALMRGRDLLEPLDPILGIKEFALIHPDISRILASNFGIHQLNSLQRCASKHILRGRNCTIIGGAREKRGKSLSYLIPIISVAVGEEEQLKKGWKSEAMLKKLGKGIVNKEIERVGPVGLFICGSYESGEKLRRHLDYLLYGTAYITILTNGTESHGELKSKLARNPEFIVVTADFALELFKNWFKYFRFERLRFLVFDDIHRIFEIHYEEAKELMQLVNHHIEKERISSFVQTVFCGQEWNDKIASATVKIAESTVLCIGAPMEAIKFGGVHVKVHHLDAEEKLQAFDELLKNDQTGHRIIIFCKDETTATQVCWKLGQGVGIPARQWTEKEKGAEALREFQNWWITAEVEDNLIIVTMDSAFRDLGIDDVQTIIHYDVPEGKQEAFGERYMAMWGHFPDISNYETEGELALEPKLALTSHLFITDEDAEMHKIVLKLHRMNCSNFEIPENLITIAEQQLADASKKLTMCDRLLATGRCRSASCKCRHIFTEADFELEPNVPRTGRVEVQILDVKDVNVYTAKINSYYEVDPRTNHRKDHISYANLARSLHGKLNEYFKNPENLVTCSNLKLGMSCAIFYHNKDDPEYQDGAYVRGKIVDALLVDKFKTMVDVRVFCTDLGHHSIKNAKEVYVLPEQFRTQKSICVKLILANLKPRADEACFPSHARSKAKTMMEGRIYTAKIVLSLGNTVWALPLQEHSRNSAGEWILRTNVRHELIKTYRAADDNPEHLQVLYNLCENAGLECDVYKSATLFNNEFMSTHFVRGGNLQWAFLPIFREDADKYQCSVTVCAVSPSIVYVQLEKFQENLDELNKTLNEHITSSIQEVYPNYDTIFSTYYEPGMVVAAQEGVDHNWNRAIITSMYKTEKEMKFNIFFVDFGDTVIGATMEDLHPISRKLVECLPFQCIGIRLDHHVEPIQTDLPPTSTSNDQGSVFSPEVGEYLERLLLPDSIGQSLDVSALCQKGNLTEYGVRVCRSYDAFVFFDAKELGEYLVDEKLAQYRSNGREELEAFKALLLEKWNRVVDKNLSVDHPHYDSDDDDADRFDVCVSDDPVKTLSQIGCPKELVDSLNAAANAREQSRSSMSAAPVVNAPERLTTSAQAEVLSVETNNEIPSNNSSGTANAGTKNTQVVSPETESVSPKLNGIKSDIIKPKIVWFQDDSSVTMRIYVLDSQEYSFTVFQNNRRVNFATKSKGKNVTRYGFQLDLYGKVDLNPSTKMNGQYLTVKLIKVSDSVYWERLTYEENEYPWITVLEMEMAEEDSDDQDDSRRLTIVGPGFMKKIRTVLARNERKQRNPHKARVSGMSDDDQSDSDCDDAALSDFDDDEVLAPPHLISRRRQ